MIVKNESNIIVRLLDSVVDIIDSYCICDTGSIDDTVQLIEEYFSTRNIPGKIVKEKFRDFGYNRSWVLRQCENMAYADYLLLLDADMKFNLNPNVNLNNNSNLSPILIADFKRYIVDSGADALYMFQGTSNFYYKN